VSVSYYLSTWLWHYQGIYPENDNFTVYRYSTFGATSVSVQHHHLDPYALAWVADWIKLANLTGDSQWKEKALAIWQNGCQLVSDGTLEINGRIRPAGSHNEAFFESNWFAGSSRERINTWLVAWPGALRLETLRRLNDFQILNSAFAQNTGGKLAAKPLFIDPVHDGAGDPAVIWNGKEMGGIHHLRR
jgi:hypothetical protein